MNSSIPNRLLPSPLFGRMVPALNARDVSMDYPGAPGWSLPENSNALKAPSGLSAEIHCKQALNSVWNLLSKLWHNFCSGNTRAVSGRGHEYTKSIYRDYNMCSLCVREHTRYTQGTHKVYTRYTQGGSLTLLDTDFRKTRTGICIFICRGTKAVNVASVAIIFVVCYTMGKESYRLENDIHSRVEPCSHFQL